jgi:hypothetical protein
LGVIIIALQYKLHYHRPLSTTIIFSVLLPWKKCLLITTSISQTQTSTNQLPQCLQTHLPLLRKLHMPLHHHTHLIPTRNLCAHPRRVKVLSRMYSAANVSLENPILLSMATSILTVYAATEISTTEIAATKSEKDKLAAAKETKSAARAFYFSHY